MISLTGKDSFIGFPENNFNINDAIIGNSFTGLCFFSKKLLSILDLSISIRHILDTNPTHFISYMHSFTAILKARQIVKIQ